MPPLPVPDSMGGGDVAPADDPARWLEMLQYTYRSPYFRATAPQENP